MKRPLPIAYTSFTDAQKLLGLSDRQLSACIGMFDVATFPVKGQDCFSEQSIIKIRKGLSIARQTSNLLIPVDFAAEEKAFTPQYYISALSTLYLESVDHHGQPYVDKETYIRMGGKVLLSEEEIEDRTNETEDRTNEAEEF